MKSILAAAAIAAFISAGPATAQEVTLRYSDLFPAAYPFGQLTADFANDVKTKTGGKVVVQVFPAGTLTPPAQCFEGVLQGLSDICQAVLAYTPGRFPLMEVVDLPSYPDTGQVTTRVANAIYKRFQPKELDAVKVLYLHAHPPGVIMTVNKPVRSLDDLKGLRIRSTGLSARILTALGASPVSMPITQAYDPLKRSVIDGTDGSFNTLRYYRFAEVTKYTTLSTDVGYVSTFAIVMNKAKWDALSPDAKKALEEVSASYVDKAAALWDRIELEGLAVGREKGHTFIPLPAQEMAKWRAAVIEPLEGDYVKRMQALNLPGSEALSLKKELIKRLSSEFAPINTNLQK